ncbi:MAG: hypothetical protein IKF49_06925 [Clostridia bacterium]|nr:hypothetical protein [Clostridia bacterium]
MGLFQRTVYPLYCKENADAVRPILAALKKSGLSVQTGSAPKDSDAVLLFLSSDLTSESEVTDTFLRCDSKGMEVLPVNLDGCTPPEVFQNALIARHSIMAERYGAEELAQKIKEALKKPSRLPWILLAAALVVLIGIGGILLTRGFRPDPDTPEPTPVPTKSPEVPDDIKDYLEDICEVGIVGEKVYYYRISEQNDLSEYPEYGLTYEEAYRTDEDTGSHWYSKEDGHEYLYTEYGDLSYLILLQNLKYLTVAEMNGTLPDLSALEHLRYVTIADSGITDLSFLRDSSITYFEYRGGPDASFSELNECKDLNTIVLTVYGTKAPDLSSFAPPSAEYMYLNGGSYQQPADLSSWKGNYPNLKCLEFEFFQLKNLLFLDGMDQLERLYLGFMSVPTLDGISNLKNLKQLVLRDAHDLADISAVEGCTALEQFRILGYPDRTTVRDLSPLGKLPNLYYISNVGVMNRDLNFLKEMKIKQDIYFVFVNHAVEDFSGFEAIDSYGLLYLNMNSNDPSEALRYLQNADIGTLQIRNAFNVDLSGLTNVKEELVLETCDVSDLSTLEDSDIRYMVFLDCSQLQSLEGLQSNRAFGRKADGTTGGGLLLEDCPHVVDWSALDGMQLEELDLLRVNTLPDFSKFTADYITLEGIPDLTDLSCFEALDRSRTYSISLGNQDGLTDISVLYTLKGDYLSIRPEWKEQAKELVDLGIFQSYEIIYPDSSWQPNDSELSLLSLEELDLLPKSVLKRVRAVGIAGEQVFNPNEKHLETDFELEEPKQVLVDNRTQQRSEVISSSESFDPVRLKDLENLEQLILTETDTASLEGIQYLTGLKRLYVFGNRNLSDVSAVFTLQGLEELDLSANGNFSLEGIENLRRLKELRIKHWNGADLTPLLSLPNLEKITVSEDMQDAVQSLEGRQSFVLVVE